MPRKPMKLEIPNLENESAVGVEIIVRKTVGKGNRSVFRVPHKIQ